MNRLEAATKELEEVYSQVRKELSSNGFKSKNLTSGADLLKLISDIEQEVKEPLALPSA